MLCLYKKKNNLKVHVEPENLKRDELRLDLASLLIYLFSKGWFQMYSVGYNLLFFFNTITYILQNNNDIFIPITPLRWHSKAQVNASSDLIAICLVTSLRLPVLL